MSNSVKTSHIWHHFAPPSELNTNLLTKTSFSYWRRSSHYRQRALSQTCVRQKKKFVEIEKFIRIIILDVMSFQNLQKLSKNLHPVPRYSSSKLVHFSCRNQFWRYNSIYGSRALLILIGLNLGSPWAPSLKKSSFRLVFFICYGAPKRPPKNKHLRQVF